jgi:hypothetical protein
MREVLKEIKNSNTNPVQARLTLRKIPVSTFSTISGGFGLCPQQAIDYLFRVIKGSK